MNKFEFKNLTPFKWFVLENFPFIEADFDALTEWQLFCKLGKEMNKIINSENTIGTEMEKLSNAFIELQNYVNNYFDNLDVQEEINNKLNDMAESGELTEIITNYIAKCVIIFDSVNSMVENENLIVGSKCKTLGFYTIGDLGNAYYEIKENLIPNGKNIIALNNGLFAQLIIENDMINPQMFGAYGYKGSYDVTKNDSTEVLRYVSKFAVDNGILKINYLGLNYNCAGNNIIGLEVKERTSSLKLNIDGNGAIFYWDSMGAENFAFAFVGYLRSSLWQNFDVRCINNTYKGNIFTTHFDMENQNHYFSENKFFNININNWWEAGSCDKVFDFSRDNATHDDLSVFEKITAQFYNKFFYTNNKESVNNTFNNCFTVSHKEETIDFEIDCDNWSGHLNINEHQFILLENNCTLIKTYETTNPIHLPININNSRLEARVPLFKFCELGGYDLKINNLQPLSSFTINHSTQYFTVKQQASIHLQNSYNLPPYIEIYAGTSNTQGQILIENCGFYNDVVVTPAPIFKYGSYNSYSEMKKAGNIYFPKITIKNGRSSSLSKWFTDFLCTPQDCVKYTSLHKQFNETYRAGYIPNIDLVIEDLKVYRKDASRCSLIIANYDGTEIISTAKDFSNGVANFTETNKFVLPRSKVKTINFYPKDENGTDLSNSSCIFEIGYRPMLFDEEFNPTVNTMINK